MKEFEEAVRQIRDIVQSDPDQDDAMWCGGVGQPKCVFMLYATGDTAEMIYKLLRDNGMGSDSSESTVFPALPPII